MGRQEFKSERSSAESPEQRGAAMLQREGTWGHMRQPPPRPLTFRYLNG